jgi:hypothetical protein
MYGMVRNGTECLKSFRTFNPNWIISGMMGMLGQLGILDMNMRPGNALAALCQMPDTYNHCVVWLNSIH